MHACTYINVRLEDALKVIARKDPQRLTRLVDALLADTSLENTARLNQVLAEAARDEDF
ncbi:MAG: hypothetical protein JOZ82_03785 [Marmoricola sp.]|nr:hypothetical protein [Marmoricola sp.]